VKLTGFNALSTSDGAVAPDRMANSVAIGGPASGKIDGTGAPDAEDWPTYRRDIARSGCAKTNVPVRLQQVWSAELKGRITPPVLASGRLFVSEVNTHSVQCLEAGTGKPVWRFTAGGPVDSPPTIHEGRVLFGCTDGNVYCLRASDGELVWRFRAAPGMKRVVSYGRVESAWPVHGSVLVNKDTVYCAAGRSSFLDGGLYLYGLDVATGAVRHRARIDGPHPDVTKKSSRAHEMDGSRNDILVGSETRIFLLQNVYDLALRPVEAPKIARWGARKTERHLVATGGFLDDSGFDRLYWMHAGRWPGLYVANTAPKAGQILVFDETTTYGLHQFDRKFSRSPYFAAGEGCELFADDNDNEPVLTPRAERAERGSMTRSKPATWTVRIPVRARAMVLAGGTLFLAGPPDVIDAKDPYGAFEGRLGGKLWAVSTKDGARLAEYALESPPVFDGLIAAKGRLYLVARDGTVTCWK
jgi:outer membrane protein assembly factor BamB